MMTTREQLLTVFREVGDRHPEMRFGQLVAFVTLLARGPSHSGVYNVEDQELLSAARAHLAQASPAEPAAR